MRVYVQDGHRCHFGCGGLLTMGVVGALILWPAMLLTGWPGIVGTGLWWVLLVVVFLYIGHLGVKSRDHSGAAGEHLYQPRHAQEPGPRDWEPAEPAESGQENEMSSWLPGRRSW